MTKKTYQLPQQFLDDVSRMDLNYVVDGGENNIYNKDGGHILLRVEMIAQNDHIKIYLDHTGDEDSAVITSQDLRDMAEKLIEWADLSDQTNQ